MQYRHRPVLGLLVYAGVMTALAFYFAFASLQGDYGLFRRMEIRAEAAELTRERDRLASDVARLENLTRRLSDDFLDLDLLDEQARDVLGLIRADEVVLR